MIAKNILIETIFRNRLNLSLTVTRWAGHNTDHQQHVFSMVTKLMLESVYLITNLGSLKEINADISTLQLGAGLIRIFVTFTCHTESFYITWIWVFFTHFTHCCVSYKNRSSILWCKTNNWFLYKVEHWAEMD